MLTRKQQKIKRHFDIILSALGIIIFCIPVLILILVSIFSIGKMGLFWQKRVGQDGRLFVIYKIRTMRVHMDNNFITIKDDSRISSFGKFLRAYKLDEFPQLYNVLIGDMSFVGPRPDVQGYADELEGDDRIILSVRPGITGPATLKYRNEEELLAQQIDPKGYNDSIIWRDKVKINKAYVQHWSFIKDLNYIYKTFFN